MLNDFINCTAFVHIKKPLTLWSTIRVNIIRETFIFYALFLMFVSHFFTGESFLVVVLDRLFFRLKESGHLSR